MDDSSWSYSSAIVQPDSVACKKCNAIHDAGKFSECQVCGGQGPLCNECELPVDVCACEDAKAYDDSELVQVGWLFWHKVNPDCRQFSKLELSEADKISGYLAIPVYVKKGDIDG